MSEELNSNVWAGVGSFFIVILGLVGFKKQIDDKVSKDAFHEYKISVDKQFQSVKEHITSETLTITKAIEKLERL